MTPLKKELSQSRKNYISKERITPLKKRIIPLKKSYPSRKNYPSQEKKYPSQEKLSFKKKEEWLKRYYRTSQGRITPLNTKKHI